MPNPFQQTSESPGKRQKLYTGRMREGEPARTLGAPRFHDAPGGYTTDGGMYVDCEVTELKEPHRELETLIDKLDSQRGCLFESSYDFPGRYARWTMGFCDPPLMFEAWGRKFKVKALNQRGGVLLTPIGAALRACDAIDTLETETACLRGMVKEAAEGFTEEERSRQPSIFSVVRALTALFHHEHEPQLGLYGAFGYDLTFQFEPVRLKQQRDASQRDLVLCTPRLSHEPWAPAPLVRRSDGRWLARTRGADLPDEILIIDVLSNAAWKLRYEFSTGNGGPSTLGLPRPPGASQPYQPTKEEDLPRRRDHTAGL